MTSSRHQKLDQRYGLDGKPKPEREQDSAHRKPRKALIFRQQFKEEPQLFDGIHSALSLIWGGMVSVAGRETPHASRAFSLSPTSVDSRGLSSGGSPVWSVRDHHGRSRQRFKADTCPPPSASFEGGQL